MGERKSDIDDFVSIEFEWAWEGVVAEDGAVGDEIGAVGAGLALALPMSAAGNPGWPFGWPLRDTLKA